MIFSYDKGNKIKQSAVMGIVTIDLNQQEYDRPSGLKTKSLVRLLLHKYTFLNNVLWISDIYKTEITH